MQFSSCLFCQSFGSGQALPFGSRERNLEIQVVWRLEMSHLGFTDLLRLNILKLVTENDDAETSKPFPC